MTVEEVVARHADRLYRIAYLYLHDSMGAEDVVQEAFLAFVRTPRPVAEPGRWLARVVRNLCLNRLRRDRREEPADPEGWPAPASGPPPDEAVGRRLDVSGALLRLPLAYRELLLWRYYLDLPVAELARELGIRPDAARQRLARARQALAALLTEEVVER
ncbi:MAG: sigma-70 family RNA polymerase sigma factor [Clostridia bacterium]|nr:sigma-70 family RNA polymerase sigma factor [Clostridia bacterium]